MVQVISFEQLCKDYKDPENIPYAELLKTEEWKNKRQEILKRDGHKCTKCGKRSTREIDKDTFRSMLGVSGKTISWSVVNSERKLTNSISDSNHYWFFNPYEKFHSDHSGSYAECKFTRAIIDGKDCALVFADKPYWLEIHHKMYVLNKLPWENFNKDLTTLCNWCHWDVHKNGYIEAFFLRDGKLISAKMTPCYRCRGAGWFPEYVHRKDGICYRCLGKRFEELILGTGSPRT